MARLPRSTTSTSSVPVCSLEQYRSGDTWRLPVVLCAMVLLRLDGCTELRYVLDFVLSALSVLTRSGDREKSYGRSSPTYGTMS